MRKYLLSAILVEVLVLVLALAFLPAFLGLGFGRENPMLNVSLIFAAVIAVGILLFVLWRRTLLREALIRRFYVSHDWIYNHEIGYAPLKRIIPDGNVYDFVIFAAEALAHMSYGFEVADAPASFEPRYLIESNVFLFHTADDPDDPEGGVVIDAWEGVLRAMVDPSKGDAGYRDIADFSNAGELAQLLAQVGATSAMTETETPAS